MTDTRRDVHTCSTGCGCRSYRCTDCGTTELVDRQTRYETEPEGEATYAPELCKQCGGPLCDSCAQTHTCEVQTCR